MKTKQKIIAGVLSMMMVAGFASPLAFAQNANVNANATDDENASNSLREQQEEEQERERERLRELQEEARQRMETEREQERQRLEAAAQQARQNRIEATKRLMEAQNKRVEKFMERFDNIMERMERRAEILDDSGVDVADIQADLLIAGLKLDATEALFESLKEQDETIIVSDQPGEIVRVFMADVRDIKKQMIALHKDLQGIARQLVSAHRRMLREQAEEQNNVRTGDDNSVSTDEEENE